MLPVWFKLLTPFRTPDASDHSRIAHRLPVRAEENLLAAFPLSELYFLPPTPPYHAPHPAEAADGMNADFRLNGH